MKRNKKAILIAVVIGDGYIHRRDLSLKLCHSKKQEEYLIYKRDLLHSLLGGKKPKINEYVHYLGDKGYPQVRCEVGHRYFKVLRRWLYPNKYEYLTYLTPQALAIWFMDDGSLIANNRYKDGTCSSARTNIHTCCSKEIANNICKYFKDTWNIKFTSFKDGNNYSIRCFHKEGKKFHRIIHPYIIPSMAYKQRFYYNTSAQPLKIKGDDIVSSYRKENCKVIDIKNYNIR